MMSSDIIHLGQSITVIVTTTSSREDARKLATGLIEKQLAACVQFDEISSIYTWQGEVQEEIEIRLLIKVIEECKIDSVRYIKEHHPYDTPEIILTAFSSEKKYYDWCKSVSSY